MRRLRPTFRLLTTISLLASGTILSASPTERSWTHEASAERMLRGGAYHDTWRASITGNGEVTLQDGRLRITNGLPSEPGTACLTHAWPAEPNGRQVLESRLAISPKTRTDGFVVGLCDGKREECFSFLPDKIIAKRSGNETDFDTTKPTTYRVETENGAFTLFAEGKKLLTGSLVAPRSSLRSSIRVGGPSSHGAGAGAVDFVRYRVFRPDGSFVTPGSGAYVRSPALAAALAGHPARVPVYLNWDFNCLVLSPEGIRDLAADAKEAGVEGLNPRISNKGALNFRSRAGTFYNERLDAFGPDYDPLRLLVEECRKQGIKATVWFDLFEAAYNRLIEEHPEFTPQGLPGKPNLSGFPCYSHAEVREHMLEIVEEFIAYEPDYVFFCTKSSHIPRNHLNRPHNRDSGFNPPVVEKYKELHGTDPLEGDFDREKLGRIRGGFLIDFLVEARRRLNAAGIETIVGATVSGRLQPAGPNLYLDWREILNREAADALLMANSRGEYYAFYDTAGQRRMEEIRLACAEARVPFWPYIISSGTHGPIAAEIGFAALLDYLPRQLRYLTAMGGDAILVHDLDLFASHDRTMRRALWRAAGDRPAVELFAAGEPVPIPAVRLLSERYPGLVPQGDFEEENTHLWAAVPSIQNQLADRVNWSFERRVDNDARPAGWRFQSSGPGVFEVCDWKVMHDDPDSGRSWHGRTSVMIGLDGEEAKAGSGGSWVGLFPLAEVRRAPIRVTVHAHGEYLLGAFATGMTVTVLDADGNVLAEETTEAPREETFPWMPLSATVELPQGGVTVQVACFLKAQGEPAAGRVWFDGLLIEDAAIPEPPEIELVSRGDAPSGRQFVRLEGADGWDFTSVPFRIPQSENSVLTVRLKADSRRQVGLSVIGSGEAEKTVTVGEEWEAFSLPIGPTDGKRDSRVLVRPCESGTLDIDAMRIDP